MYIWCLCSMEPGLDPDHVSFVFADVILTEKLYARAREDDWAELLLIKPSDDEMTSTIVSLLPKLSNTDSDHRFMALNDLHDTLTSGPPGILRHESSLGPEVVDGILKRLDDNHGEVQGLAIKCLAPLVRRISSYLVALIFDRLPKIEFRNCIDDSVRSAALRTVITNLPQPVPGEAPSAPVIEAYRTISRYLFHNIVGRFVILRPGTAPLPGIEITRPLLVPVGDARVSADAIDVVVELGRCYGPLLRQEEIKALRDALNNILADEQSSSSAKKRAVVALSVLAIYFSDDLLSAFVSQLIEGFRDPHLAAPKRRLLVTITGAMARSISKRFGPHLQTLAPFILSPVGEAELVDQTERMAEDGESDSQLDEVREAALAALESFLTFCSADMRFYSSETVEAALRFLKYDPNLHDDDDDDDMAGSLEDADDLDFGDDADDDDDDYEFGDLEAFNDEGDVSWRVRRCAAKVLHALVLSRARGDLLEEGTLHQRIAPALVRRFKERDENVRLEILDVVTLFVRKTGESDLSLKLGGRGFDPSVILTSVHNRKRRRGSSDVSMLDAQAMVLPVTNVSASSSGPPDGLAAITPAIVRGALKLLEMKSQPTKQASVALLRILIVVRPGCLAEHLAETVKRIIELLTTSTSTSTGAVLASTVSGAASATGSSLRIETLSLVATLAQTHDAAVLRPFLPDVVSCVTTAARDRFYKISSEAIKVAEQLIRVVTSLPRRQSGEDASQPDLLGPLYDVVMDRANTVNVDSEVKQQAVHALGVILARSSRDVLSQPKRNAALGVLYERLQNEITRRAAMRAVHEVVLHASSSYDLPETWTRAVMVELSAQLRKANRSLRVAGLTGLKDLVLNPSGVQHLDRETTKVLKEALTPLLNTNDLHMLGPSLVMLTKFAELGPEVIDGAVVSAISSLALADLAGTVLDTLLNLVKTIGEQGAGAPLMNSLLQDVGVNGDPAVVGRLIGTLLVCGGPKTGVSLDDFVKELERAQDDKRKCLALSVIGEAALRLGLSSPLEPEAFIAHFRSKSDQVPLAAAMALGRAGVGDVAKYIPVVLDHLDKADISQYLLLHSIKEILQHRNVGKTGLAPFSKQIWEKVILVSQQEDNKALGAECVGRLIVIDPKSYLAPLQMYLRDQKASVRGVMISAFRYALSDSDESSDSLFHPMIAGTLKTILEDDDLENGRLAMSTLMAANHNKPRLIAPHFRQLLPPVITATIIKPELIREVQMGPFKHKIDDGLELRKTAFETLYAVVETAFPHVDVVEIFDRVMAGLSDEHDIGVLSNLTLSKLLALEPNETSRRLNEIADRFRAILSFKPKESAVKQEVEMAEEASKGALKATVQLMRAFPGVSGHAEIAASGPRPTATADSHQVWRYYCDWVRKEFHSQVKTIEQESSSRMDD